MALDEARIHAAPHEIRIGGRARAGAKKAAREARKTDREVEANRLDKVAATYVDRYVKREVGAAWGTEIELTEGLSTPGPLASR